MQVTVRQEAEGTPAVTIRLGEKIAAIFRMEPGCRKGIRPTEHEHLYTDQDRQDEHRPFARPEY